MSDETHKKSGMRENFEAIVIALIFLNFVRIFTFQSFKIPTGSMIDNLLIGDHLFVNKFIFGVPGPLQALTPLRDVERGDIVVFRFPEDPAVDYVKRVIALPGETVTIRDKVVHVNGKALDESYVSFRDPTVIPSSPGLPEPFRSRDQFGPFTVPPGEYFMMGDNRDDSYDSRYWGTVPRPLIKGRPFLVYWSFQSDPSDPTRPPSILATMVDVVTNFYSKTRWDRMFFIVDSRYHYPFQ
jgi:signal peptidase I